MGWRDESVGCRAASERRADEAHEARTGPVFTP